MTIVDFLAQLQQLKIKLWIDDGQLAYSAPKGALTPELRTELRARKEEVLAFLRAASGGTTPSPTPIARADDPPASFAQQRLWLLDQLTPGSALYNLPAAVRLSGALDVAALESSLSEIVRRHETLRTTFAERATTDSWAGPLVQVITPPAPAALHLQPVDLQALSPAQREALAQRLIDQEARQPFDLQRGPLMRAALLRLQADEHILLLTLHHSIADGWSLGVLVRELATLYSAACDAADLRAALPALPVQYADYALWQRQQLAPADAQTASGPMQQDIDYWRKQLADAPTALELPLDRARPAATAYRSATCRATLDAELTGALNTLSQREGVTLFMTLLAAFKLLLARHTGQHDVLIGTPVAGRTRAELEGLIGCFLNTLALRTDLSGDPTFHELLQRVRATTIGAYAHQETPFELLIEALQLQREAQPTPLLRILFNMLNYPFDELALPGLSTTILLPPDIGAKFDLTLYVSPQPAATQLELVYNAELFDSARMDDLLQQFCLLLAQVAAPAAQPDQPISAIGLVTPAARIHLPDPAAPLTSTWHGSVQQALARQRERAADKIALRDARSTWSYAALDDWSSRIAQFLVTQGIQPGALVAIYAHRSAALVAALVGVLKSGARFTILDPAYPAARLLAQIEVATPEGWLQLEAAGALPDRLRQRVAATVRCRLVLPAQPIDGLLDAYPPHAPAIEIGPDDPAYIAFTSGSTGRPKAIVGTQRPLTHFLDWHSRTFALDAADRFSMLSGLAHDPLLRDIFTPLWLGATLCIPDPAQIGFPGWLADWMQREAITVAHLTPALGQLLSESAATTLPALRYAFYGGDDLTERDVARLRALAPSATSVNFYGATETPQAMGWYVVPDNITHTASESSTLALPIGHGIEAVQLLVLSAHGQQAGIGELGEIYVRTPYLTLGYLNDPAATAARFLNTQAVLGGSADPSDRLYRTGDLGRYQPDGSVRFAGRADQQVKIRGYRVELGEIEAALAAQPGVRDYAVIVREDAQGDSAIVAYVVADASGCDPLTLYQALSALLPPYMLPAQIVPLDALPLTPNGKLDRRALPDPQQSDFDLLDLDALLDLHAQHSPTEAALVTIWTELLDRPTITVNDNFFLLGGHSLLATRLLARVRDALGVAVALPDFFERPTIAALAQHIDAARDIGNSAPHDTIPLAPRDRPLPLSFGQQRLWLLDQLTPGSAAYNLPAALRLHGALDVAALSRSLNLIIRRHEALRTVIAMHDSQPVQVIQPPHDLPLRTIDLTALPDAERSGEAERLAVHEARQPFDLHSGPLVRATLLRLSPAEHILLLTMHHIVSDGVSTGVLIHEIGALYNALVNDPARAAEVLPPLAVQYADVALWQRQRLDPASSDTRRQHLDYWREHLRPNGAALPVLELPTDRPRPPVQSGAGARQTVLLPTALAQALTSLGQHEGATLFMTLLAAFQTLLHRYSGQDTIVVGTPIANRARPELEPLIGMFVNTLALRADLGDDPSFRALLGRVRAATLQAYEHQELPFELLVESLQPQRDLSRSPLFQVLFALQNSVSDALHLTGLRIEPLVIDPGTTRFDLTLEIGDTPRGLIISCEYNRDLFDAPTIARMLGHYSTLLTACLVDPDQPISALPLLSADERQQVLAWSYTAGHAPDRGVHTLIVEQAARTPDAVAVVCAEQHLTYAQLVQRASQLAYHLQQYGVGPDTPVAIALERSPELIVALLAVLSAGGYYLPLDLAHPAARRAYLLRETQPALIVTRRDLQLDLATQSGVLYLDELDATLDARSATPPSSSVAADHLAYVLFTSGSTGQPKGVQITHGAVSNLLGTMQQQLALTPADTLLAITTLSFDIAALELFLPLIVGARIVLARRDEVADPAWLRATLDSGAITVMQATPSTWRQLLTAGWRGTPGLAVLSGGEALPPDLAAALLPAGRALWNLYGPTEATIWATTQRIAETTPPATIGSPLANTSAYVLDERLAPVPLGVVGELYLGGVQLARGYLNQPALTAARFLPDPFAPTPGARLYRTGDRARWQPDGTLAFLGRADTQLKLRGFRIEPAEIEAALVAQPGVHAAAVLLHDERLVAYVVGEPRTKNQEPGREGTTEQRNTGAAEHGNQHQDPKASTDGSGFSVLGSSGGSQFLVLGSFTLRAALRERLPEYMIPALFVFLEALPLTPNGKLDRRALPAPDLDDLHDADQTAPRSALEALLAELWAELLGLKSIGIHSNFFELGGHSLLATQLVARIQHAVGIELPLRTLFEQPTIAGLAAHIATLQDTAQTEALPPLVPVERDGPLPLSFAQQRFWLLDQLNPGDASLTIPAALWLQGPLDVAALEQSLRELVARHEALRTTFAQIDGQPVQLIHPQLSVPLMRYDLQAQPAETRVAEVLRLAAEIAQQPFDLEQGPLVRPALFRCDEQTHLLLLALHHSIADEWSIRVLARELSACYAAYRMDQMPALPALPIQYADVAVWQRRMLQGDLRDRLLGYWQQQLTDLPALALPTDRPRPAQLSSQAGHSTIVIAPELIAALETIGRREGATLFMTLLTAFQTLLHRYSGQNDLAVGTPVANRSRTELEPLVGCLINTLVLRADLSGDPSFRELLSRVRATSLQAFAHQELPFELLVETLQPSRDLRRHPLVQALFVLETSPLPAHTPADLTLRPQPLARASTNFDLTLTIRPEQDGYYATLEYAADLFDAATIARMLGHFETLLASIAAAPGTPIGALTLLSDAELHQLRQFANHDAHAARLDQRDADLVQLRISAQAQRQPDAIAVVSQEEQVSYGDLNRRANQLAQHLRARGVQPEARVAICLERSLDLVVALLAVLKAGGAYLPLDPDYPAERLQLMLDDAQPVALLTTHAVAARHGLSAAPQITVIELDSERAAIQAAADSEPLLWISSEHAAYVIYTSGSTGHPKGVVVPHRALAHHSRTIAQRYALQSSDRGLQFAALSFDVAAEEIFPSLISGATVVLRPHQLPATGAEFVAFVAEARLSVLNLPTAYWRLWVAALGQPAAAPPPDLRLLIIGSEAVQTADLRRWREQAGERVRWLNAYGLTETTITSTLYEAEAHIPDSEIVPIGRPLSTTSAYVLNERLAPVPLGVVGELYLGGVQLARGYLNQPALTAARFLPDPFAPTPGARLYRTGDRARWQPDGTLAFLGRADTQLKLRGFRIEPAEIEAALLAQPGVHAAAVLLHDERLVAYVVEEPRTKNQEPNGEEPRTKNQEPGREGTREQTNHVARAAQLRETLRARLPEHMIPALFVVLDALPLMPNGKLDRKALPAPNVDDPRAQAESGAFTAARTPLEELLATIWAATLGMQTVGVHDSFFALGGHSLSAAQLIARLRETLQIELPLRALFEQPTVAGLAATIEAQRWPTLAAAPPLVPVERDGPLPLSFAQEQLWLLDQLQPGATTYNMPAAVRLRGILDLDALEQSLRELVARHEALRTTFTHDPSRHAQPAQVIAPVGSALANAAATLARIDLGDHNAELNEVLQREAEHRFDLQHGPLLRVTLIRLAADQHILLVVLHHIIADQWSLAVLIRELGARYSALVTGEHMALPPLAVQYADYAVWQRAWLDQAETARGYWHERLRPGGSGLPAPLELPTDRPRPATPSFRGGHHRFVLPPELVAAVEALGRREGATPFMTLLAAFQTLLHRYSGQDDLVIGAPVATRSQPAVENVIGMFVNTLVLRADLSGDPTFRALLGRVRAATLDDFAHQDYPFARLVAEIQPERAAYQTPLFQVAFIIQHEPLPELALPGVTLQPLDLATQTARFDLALTIELGPPTIGVFEYSSDLFDAATIARMAEHLVTLLSAAVTQPEQPIALLPLLSEAERRHLLHDDPAGSRSSAAPMRSGEPYPYEQCAHQLFEAQAARTPDAVALVFADGRLSYRELNQRANQVAHRLQALGIGPDMLVGLYLRRTSELVIGLLAVLKAGGAYLPLDPDYPPERIAQMVDDAQPPVVLTTEALVPELRELCGAQTALVALDAADAQPALDTFPTENPASGVTPQHLAYVIYTSGSTGRPKGVMIEHGQIVNTLFASAAHFGIDGNDRLPCIASFSFDIALFELLSPLIAGGTAYLVRKHEVLDLPRFATTLAELTFIHSLPSLMRQIVDYVRQTGRAYPRLRKIFVGGDLIPVELVRDMQSTFPGAQIFMGYGPTEAAIMCTNYVVPAEGSVSNHIIGKALHNMVVRIYDARQQLVPIGVAGEIYIGGVGVGRGYLNRPELSAEKFVTIDGQRFYRTGDRARYLADGNIEFLGRIDEQVKVRGFRIEPGEIETLLSGHPAVQQAVVVVRDDLGGAAGEKQLVAYVVPEQAAAARTDEIELWPSVSEYPAIYDDMLYYAMSQDQRRLDAYRAGIEASVRGKVVLEIGPGREALLARYCIAAGARKVYAVELSAETHALASAEIARLGLSDRIVCIHGDVLDVVLPEPAEVCVAALFGSLASSEGVAAIYNGTRRLLTADAVMIPNLARTAIAAVSLPDELIAQPRFTPIADYYARRISEHFGQPGDLRLCLGNLPTSALCSTVGEAERLVFNAPVPLDEQRELRLLIERDTTIDGLAAWLTMDFGSDQTVDILADRQSLLPVYFPLFEPSLAVRRGDTIVASFHRHSADGTIYPDYSVSGVVLRQDGTEISFEHRSPYRPEHYAATPFYQRLWDTPATRPSADLVAELRAFVRGRLPDYMVPTAFMVLDSLPLSTNGKVDRKALPAPQTQPQSDGARTTAERRYLAPASTLERTIAAIWQQVLGVEQVGLHDNFFDLGGHSLLLVRVHSLLRDTLQREIAMVDLFQHPTVHDLASYLSDQAPPQPALDGHTALARPTSGERNIAIIGMAGQFPGAPTVERFWQNLLDGVESIAFFDDDELLAAGITPATLRDPQYVKAGGMLDGIELFDAPFFGYTPREAELIDPQQRLFLECAWTALEDAGYDAERYNGQIGVYAGAGISYYLLFNLLSNYDRIDTVGKFQAQMGTGNDFVATRVSYKLNLRGPSVAINTACSTSLVATHLACQGLQEGQCDMALAGGVALGTLHKTGYLYQEGGINAPDGHCRAFDAEASGTVPGSGVGAVVLKRLDDALRDGDPIYAVIKGSAINNDGAHKVGYTAPSVSGQAQVIAAAQRAAGIDPATIGYIETHGTGTALGDPIEIAALTQAFRQQFDGRGSCAIGSLKTNIGHADAAAGVAGLIKAALTLQHGLIPPSLHYSAPNPQIDFDGSPFFVNTALQPWPRNDEPRRAAVSAFGIGGTNAHMVLEEAPALPPSGPSRPWQVLVLSAKTPAALETLSDNLAAHLRAHPDQPLADVAYTLQIGRRALPYRRMLVCHDHADAIAALEQRDQQRVLSAESPAQAAQVVLMFPGGGAQYIEMGRELYEHEPNYRATVDRCAALLLPLIGADLREVLFPAAEQRDEATQLMRQTALGLPALFVTEYALAQLWLGWGVQPTALAGHSLGEYVAATLAGVFSLEDALLLVATRGRLMQQLPPGGMLNVPLGEAELLPLLEQDGAHSLDLAAINGPAVSIVSGPRTSLDQLHQTLLARGVESQRVLIDVAAHSAQVEPILAEFHQIVAGLKLQPPRVPLLSNVSGTWLRDDEATDPDYWTRHLRQTVRFADNLAELLRDPARVLLEVGPGRTLSALVKRQPVAPAALLGSLRHPNDPQSDVAFLLTTLARLWLAGTPIDWATFAAHEQRHRVKLPTYPFERQRYWVEPRRSIDTSGAQMIVAPGASHKSADPSGWAYVPSWHPTGAPDPGWLERLAEQPQRWLILLDRYGLGTQLAERLVDAGQIVVTAERGTSFAQHDARRYTLDPSAASDYVTLLQALAADELLPQTIVHGWSVDPLDADQSSQQRFMEAQTLGYSSLVALAQALHTCAADEPVTIAALSSQAVALSAGDALAAEKATLLAPCKTIPQEWSHLLCRSIDVALPRAGSRALADLAAQIAADLAAPPHDLIVAYRQRQRWTQSFAAIPLEPPTSSTRLRQRGVYLITGGLGRIGTVLAEELARTVQARLVLVGRTPLPDRSAWDDWIAQHDADDPLSRRIETVRALEAHGAEVLVASADVADEAQIGAVIEQTIARFGALHGVIHAAVFHSDLSANLLPELDAAGSAAQFGPKVWGAQALAQALGDHELDFCYLCSSLSALLGGIGFTAYAAANLYLDAFAHEQSARGDAPWTSINWEAWRFEAAPEPTAGLGATLAGLALTPDEGVEIFRRLVATSRGPQLAISTSDLPSRIAYWTGRASRQRTEPEPTANNGSAHARPQTRSSYVAPGDAVEHVLASIWQELLGIVPIGAQDNFFELGGDSLLGTELVARIRRVFQIDLPLKSFFHAATVADVARALREHETEPGQVMEIAEVWLQIEQMADDDLLGLLEEKRSLRGEA